MLARDYCDAAGRKKGKPIILSHHMLYGLKAGQAKMSKSDPDSAIFMEDSTADVRRKIRGAYCPRTADAAVARDAEMQLAADDLKNPCLDYVRHVVFAAPGATFAAGGATFASADAVRDAFVGGALSEADLKDGLADAVDALLAPVRAHFERDARRRAPRPRARLQGAPDARRRPGPRRQASGGARSRPPTSPSATPRASSSPSRRRRASSARRRRAPRAARHRFALTPAPSASSTAPTGRRSRSTPRARTPRRSPRATAAACARSARRGPVRSRRMPRSAPSRSRPSRSRAVRLPDRHCRRPPRPPRRPRAPPRSAPTTRARASAPACAAPTSRRRARTSSSTMAAPAARSRSGRATAAAPRLRAAAVAAAAPPPPLTPTRPRPRPATRTPRSGSATGPTLQAQAEGVCEPGNADANPPLPSAPRSSRGPRRRARRRPPENGGDARYGADDLDRLVADVAAARLHPGDLKPAVAAALRESVLAASAAAADYPDAKKDAACLKALAKKLARAKKSS